MAALKTTWRREEKKFKGEYQTRMMLYGAGVRMGEAKIHSAGGDKMGRNMNRDR